MIGEKIKMLRTSQGLSQTDFAKRLFVTPAAVNQWERDVSTPSTDRLIQIANEFSVPLDFFSSDSAGKKYSEAELIRKHILIELGATRPKTAEAKILARGIDKLPKEQREMAINIMKAVFAQHADYFERTEEDEAGL